MDWFWRKIPRQIRIHWKSIKTQITVTCLGLLAISLIAILFINHTFLESYYVHRKEEVLLAQKEKLEEMDLASLLAIDEDQEQEEADEEELFERTFTHMRGLQKGSSSQNLTWAVLDLDTMVTFTYPENDKFLASKVQGYALHIDQDSPKGKVIGTYDGFLTQLAYDRLADMDFLECWGKLESGYSFLIRIPLESIKDSVNISNTFYVFVGCFIIVLGAMVIFLVTRKITGPIIELTGLSERMSHLDFDARYTIHAGNEIDKLGESLNFLSSTLEKTISELKSANIELQADIEDKIKIDEMRKEFLDNVSHELKTPIALIQGYAEGLKDGITDDPESTAFYCDVILDEAVKMNKLVSSLLTLNQLESGRDTPVMERIDLTELIRGVLAKMDIMIGQSHAKIQFEQEQPVYVWADEFKIEEVLTNYVSNALHHVSGDNVIDIRIDQEADKARVTVFNSGLPIPEEALPNLWTKFYKVDKARTREYGGSGIGLSIVKAIMESMHQEYGVQNYDNGVGFYFTLDLK